MKRTSLVLFIATLLTAISLTFAEAAVKAGAVCPKAGKTSTENGRIYTCIKLGSKLYWNNGTLVSPSSSTKQPTATPPETFIMPKVVGLNLQLAQDLLQSKGSYLIDQVDFKGLNRFQVLDSNWKVCTQSPSAGKKIPISTVVALASVKLTERC
jgi:hypothetical protein